MKHQRNIVLLSLISWAFSAGALGCGAAGEPNASVSSAASGSSSGAGGEGGSGAQGGNGGGSASTSTGGTGGGGNGGSGGNGGNPCLPVDDGNTCTEDVCENDVPVHNPISDNACTETDTCQVGVCTSGTPVVCTALDTCHAAGTCDPATGCSNPVIPDGVTCNDNDECTQTDTCLAGTCTGSNPILCSGANVCIFGTCAPPPCTGTLSFPGMPIAVTGQYPRAVIAADLDGDGKLDLAAANPGTPDTVSVFLNKGDGTFGAKEDYLGNLSLAIADMNGDGRSDFALADDKTKTISILLNTCLP